jgi:DNA-binding NtrC family response regulator
MSTPTTILVYGRDTGLLQTRQWLLEASGYRVLTATEISEVKGLVAEEGIDLLILCHSLSTEETQEALAAVAAPRPKIHTLIMAAYYGSHPSGMPDAVLEVMDGPAQLVSVVERLVQRPDGGSTRGGVAA